MYRAESGQASNLFCNIDERLRESGWAVMIEKKKHCCLNVSEREQQDKR